MTAILFDLDGTLVDSLGDLADSTNAMLIAMGAPTHPLSAYRMFVGDGAQMLVMRALPDDRRDEGTVAEALEKLMWEYAARWNVSSRPYPGIIELLSKLVDRKIPLAVLSNKPDPFAQQMVRLLLPEVPFTAVRGAMPDVPKKPDPTAALELATILGHRAEQCFFVGDSNVDIRTGLAAGMRAIGVGWGFRTVDELRESGAHEILETPSDLLSLV